MSPTDTEGSQCTQHVVSEQFAAMILQISWGGGWLAPIIFVVEVCVVVIEQHRLVVGLPECLHH